jgi:hypothetical protein
LIIYKRKGSIFCESHTIFLNKRNAKAPLSIGMHSGVKASKGDSIVLPIAELAGQTRELEEQMEKTTHHNFVAVLKEVSEYLPISILYNSQHTSTNI